MDKQEQHALAQQLADNSNVLDFESALQIVRYRPAEAEKRLREKEESKKRMEDLTEANRRLRLAARELF